MKCPIYYKNISSSQFIWMRWENINSILNIIHHQIVYIGYISKMQISSTTSTCFFFTAAEKYRITIWKYSEYWKLNYELLYLLVRVQCNIKNYGFYIIHILFESTNHSSFFEPKNSEKKTENVFLNNNNWLYCVFVSICYCVNSKIFICLLLIHI